MSIAPTLQKYLAAENIQYEVIPHEFSMTSTRTAEACHISGDRLAKGIVLRRDGEYILANLPVGPYQIEVSKEGFSKYTQSGIVLEGGQQARLDVILQIGSASETVEVVAGSFDRACRLEQADFRGLPGRGGKQGEFARIEREAAVSCRSLLSPWRRIHRVAAASCPVARGGDRRSSGR